MKQNVTGANHSYVANARNENNGVKVVTAIFGAVHFGLSLAAEAVSCAEAGIVEKMTNGEIKYHQVKDYRTVETYNKIATTKKKVRDAEAKLKEMQERTKAKYAAKAETPTVELKTA